MVITYPRRQRQLQAPVWKYDDDLDLMFKSHCLQGVDCVAHNYINKKGSGADPAHTAV